MIKLKIEGGVRFELVNVMCDKLDQESGHLLECVVGKDENLIGAEKDP